MFKILNFQIQIQIVLLLVRDIMCFLDYVTYKTYK